VGDNNCSLEYTYTLTFLVICVQLYCESTHQRSSPYAGCISRHPTPLGGRRQD
jgi:hypothetical protein